MQSKKQRQESALDRRVDDLIGHIKTGYEGAARIALRDIQRTAEKAEIDLTRHPRAKEIFNAKGKIPALPETPAKEETPPETEE